MLYTIVSFISDTVPLGRKPIIVPILQMKKQRLCDYMAWSKNKWQRQDLKSVLPGSKAHTPSEQTRWPQLQAFRFKWFIFFMSSMVLKQPSPYTSCSCSPNTAGPSSAQNEWWWMTGLTFGWPPTVSSLVQTKWWDQAHWGYNFYIPLKVILLFLLVRCFCFLAKPILAIGICQYVNGFTVFQQQLSSKHLLHRWQKLELGTGWELANNQDPHNSIQVSRLERMCQGKIVILIFRSDLPRSGCTLANWSGVFCAWQGDSSIKISSLRHVSSPLGREPICPTVSEITLDSQQRTVHCHMHIWTAGSSHSPL